MRQTITKNDNSYMGGNGAVLTFEGDWPAKTGAGHAIITPKFVLVPVDAELRLTFAQANDWVTRFAYIVAQSVATPMDLEWSLDLTTTGQTKTALRSGSLDLKDVKRVLFQPQPRFVWVARVTQGGKTLAQLLLDGTAVPKAFPVLDVLFCDSTSRETVRTNLASPGLERIVTAALVDFLRNKTDP